MDVLKFFDTLFSKTRKFILIHMDLDCGPSFTGVRVLLFDISTTLWY